MNNQPFQSNQTYINNSSSSPKQIQNAIIVLTALFFVVIITITILNPLLHHNSIAPVSPETSSLLSNDDLSTIESSIKNHISNAYDITSDQLNNLSIVIRENTIKSTSNNNNSLSTISFIVDLNSPELTFNVEYQPSEKTVFLTCPTIDLVQNPDVFCIGAYNQSTIDVNLDQYLPYYDTAPSDVDFSISHHSNDSYSEPQLNIYANVCGDETLATEIETIVKEWIRSKGIKNPNIIPLHFPRSYCNERD